MADIGSNSDASKQWLYIGGLGVATVGAVGYANRNVEPPHEAKPLIRFPGNRSGELDDAAKKIKNKNAGANPHARMSLKAIARRLIR